MRVRVFQLFFKADGDPVDERLYTLVDKYAREHMTFKVDFKIFKNVWAACEMNEEDQPDRCLGFLCMVFRADFPVCKFTDNIAIAKLVQRANDHLHDLYSQRGNEALICIAENESPETRCPHAEEWMKAFGLTPANRWSYIVR